MSQPTVMLKKARTTDIAAASRMEVRLENVSKPQPQEIEKPAEGRSRRQRGGAVSYKEASVRQKMRQVKHLMKYLFGFGFRYGQVHTRPVIDYKE